jgi:hypothetical protein
MFAFFLDVEKGKKCEASLYKNHAECSDSFEVKICYFLTVQ